MAKVTINGQDYDSDNLSDEAKSHIQNLNFVQQELLRVQSQAAVLKTAQSAYSTALQKALNESGNS